MIEFNMEQAIKRDKLSWAVWPAFPLDLKKDLWVIEDRKLNIIFKGTSQEVKDCIDNAEVGE